MRPADESYVFEIDREAERFHKRKSLRLRFQPDLEHKYDVERAAARRRQLAVMGFAALLVYDLFLVGDYLTGPREMWLDVVVRLGVVTPTALLVAWKFRRASRVATQDKAAAAVWLFAYAAVLFLNQGANSTGVMQTMEELLLLLLSMNTLIRPDFRISAYATGTGYFLFLGFLLSTGRVPGAEELYMAGTAFWFAALSLTANYALTRESRLSWLLRSRERIQRKLLSADNRALRSLSYTDQLTGIPNRTAYEQRLRELWRDAIHHGTSLAAVMVDVDHFKSINDSFGHLYGDRVLQRVATLLQQAMRVENDFIARYGGEEFVVLLPGSSLKAGFDVAERIRVLVEVAGSPAFNRSSDEPLPENVRWSTVSCGVAVVLPQEGIEPQSLIDAADLALYAAKQTGRNRVCCSEAHQVLETA